MIEVVVTHSRDDFLLDVALRNDAPVLGLFGPTGAGKTTLLDVVSGLSRAARERIVVDGQVLADTQTKVHLAPERRCVGYLRQGARLFPHLDVRGNLECGWRLLADGERRIALEQVIASLELEPLLGRAVDGLSGGEQRRVALGRALAASPRLLLLDEPCVGLDAARVRSTLDLLDRVAREFRVPMLVVSHSLSELQALTDTVAFLDAGRLLAVGELFEAIADPRAFELAARLGLENVVAAEVLAHQEHTSRVRAAGGVELVVPRLDVVEGACVRLGLRPSDLLLTGGVAEKVSARNALATRVVDVRTVGHAAIVTLGAGEAGALKLRAEVTLESVAALGLVPGARVQALVKAFALRHL